MGQKNMQYDICTDLHNYAEKQNLALIYCQVQQPSLYRLGLGTRLIFQCPGTKTCELAVEGSNLQVQHGHGDFNDTVSTKSSHDKGVHGCA